MVGGHATSITVDGFVETARDLEQRGFDTMWIPHVFGHDAIGCAALVGRATERIELGTAVVPSYPRHPTALAQQALTAGAACRGRFALGVGLSHPPVIEQMLGLSYTRRASHMREYLAVLSPLLRGEAAAFRGQEYRVEMRLEVPGAEPVPVLLAALGEKMLALAGAEAAGTILWMTGFRAIEQHVVPKLRAAAARAGRPEPRVVAGMHMALTSNLAAANARVERLLARYSSMPSYRAMIEREGSTRPADFALLGDERVLDAGLERLQSIGVTDLDANILEVDGDTRARTLDYLQSRC